MTNNIGVLVNELRSEGFSWREICDIIGCAYKHNSLAYLEWRKAGFDSDSE